jgi:hypothetical protein
MVRKRAPGAGRKPKQGPRASPLSLRMSADIRAGLEVSAAQRKQGKGWTLSEEILHRLRLSFDRERNEKRDQATRALCYLLAETIAAVARNAEPNWRSDPWSFRAIKLAFDQILDALEPIGEMRARVMDQSEPYAGIWAPPGTLRFQLGGGTPEEMAHFVRDVILDQLRPLDAASAENRTRDEEDFEYGMSDAFRVLKPKEPSQ